MTPLERKVSKYIRYLAKQTGDHCRVYATPTDFGRSYRVMGWGNDHYVNAIVQLQVAGVNAGLRADPKSGKTHLELWVE